MTLPNALCEVLLLVGEDEKALSATSVSADIADAKFKPKVLSAISGDTMMNFIPVAHRVDSYPPGKILDDNVKEKGDKIQEDSDDGNKKSSHFSKRRIKPLTRKRQLDRMMRLVHSRLGGNDAENPNLPISYDVIHSLPSYCFPNGFRVYKERPETSTNSFAYMDESKQILYITYLTFFRLYTIEKDDIDNLYFTLDMNEQEALDGDELRCFIPRCCVIISKFPYRTALKECLSCVLPYVEKSPEEMTTFIKEFAYVITHTPVPPAGNLGVNFRLYNLDVTLKPPTHPDKPVIDLELNLVFLCFNAEEFLKILSCVLLEKRIVFLSSSYDLLTRIMESVLHLILPFKWKCTFSTVLPAEKINYLKSPGKFLYGVHSGNRKEVEQVADLVVVDIDNGTVSLTNKSNTDSAHTESKGTKRQPALPDIPSEVAKLFIDKMTRVNRTFAITGTLRPCSFKNKEEHKDKTKKRVLGQNRCITSLCLKLMVDLFSVVIPKLNVHYKYFDKARFLEEHLSDGDFYERIFQTEMFRAFLEERIIEKTDYWSELETKTRLLTSSIPPIDQNMDMAYALSQNETIDKEEIQGEINVNMKEERTTDTKKEMKIEMKAEIKGEIKFICLKDFTLLENHTDNTRIQISNALQCACDGDEKASLYYIRALINYAKNEILAAMQDFIDMSTINVRILPIKIISELYTRLTDEENSKFMNIPGHEILLYYMKVLEEREKDCKAVWMHTVVIPDSDIEYSQFEEIISLKHMSNNYNTIRDLFDALSIVKITPCSGEFVQTKVVQHTTLQIFSHCWDNRQIQCKKVKLKRNLLKDDEIILKISKPVQTDFGHGRIGLTDKRLFFLDETSNQFQEITKLRKIKNIDTFEMSGMFYGVLNGVQALTIERKGERTNRFTVYLNEDRNRWYMVIREMWAGKVVSEAMKDIMMVQHAIQNTLLIDAIIASGQDERTTHFMKSESAADKVSSFYHLYREGKHILPQDTKDALQLKLDVNFGESERKTVYSLLYIGGDGTYSKPRLWCGLRDGIVKVFSAVTWLLEKVIVVEPSQACIACLTPIGDSQVWVGSSGIHIIDVQSLICTKTLLEHDDQVVDIVLATDKRFVYTASLEGTIIKWNLQKLYQEKEKISLKHPITSLKICQDHVICGGMSSLFILDLNGTLLRTVTLKDDENMLEMSCCLILENGEVWTGAKHEGKIRIFDISTGQVKHEISVSNCRGICSINVFDDKVWAGTKEGKIYIYSSESYSVLKHLDGHEGAVRVLYDIRKSKSVLHSYMISGGSSKDGRVCIWNALAETFEDFVIINCL